MPGRCKRLAPSGASEASSDRKEVSRMSEASSPQEPRFTAIVGIDWGDRKHAWSFQAAGSERRERGEIEHSPEAVGSWVSMLSARFDGQPVAVAVRSEEHTSELQ